MSSRRGRGQPLEVLRAPAAVDYSSATEIKALYSFMRLDYQMARNQNLSFRWLRESAPTIAEGLEDNLSTYDNRAIENDTGAGGGQTPSGNTPKPPHKEPWEQGFCRGPKQ